MIRPVRLVRISIFFAAILFTLVALHGPANVSAQEKSSSPPATLEGLAWMAGHWQTAAGRTQSEEHWTNIAGNTMLGVSRTIAGGKTVFFEFLRLEARPDGIYYVAHPQARPGTDFKLTKLEGQQATFENPAHDFPKRIIYRKNPDGSLTARIDGGEGVTKGAQEFSFRASNPH